jgi:hypothetical protein
MKIRGVSKGIRKTEGTTLIMNIDELKNTYYLNNLESFEDYVF